ncbi:hypothetical protein EYZ11_000143 [Aspergillus tanneri]|uniref:Uncharacterized protein n=1 Tax=Aspergillus tanneri TaxID=1220188 RepID=A0A4S3JY15_9EURO|nr:uncharacterized protein ATNIH1004_005650 [Aspergillus tanneri]KAA8646971.1 hypothetical protein ATNIH1004_005650 [Aspergillus tanneri]THD00416.1 hypothetical protein EYZ11_000143 [Aspergillus tanneri]
MRFTTSVKYAPGGHGYDITLNYPEFKAIRYEDEDKEFKPIELSSTEKHWNPEVMVKPYGGRVWVYQKQYQFSARIIGRDSQLPMDVRAPLLIDAYELMVTREALQGSTQITADAI